MKNRFLIPLLLTVGLGLVGLFWGQFQTRLVAENISQGVVIHADSELSALQQDLKKRITDAESWKMTQSGLAGVMGEIHVKINSSRVQEVLLPVPQLADYQVPLCYFFSSDPPDAVTEVRLRRREDCNDVVSVRLMGKGREVQICWSSVVLMGSRHVTPNTTTADLYRTATACVQSQSDEVAKLAAQIWPRSGQSIEFTLEIQDVIHGMKRKQPPRSLDALGILHSGENSICTANANLAAALMRSKGIACRSIAVVPTISQRLEMHRIVEYCDHGHWIAFDPSSLQIDIPAKPWQNIIMSKTTISDEQTAMKPRMGSMIGCPYGQEAEMLSSGVNFHGQDFFWTIAKPLAEFEPSEEAVRLATEEWTRFLETGTLTQGQRKLLEMLKSK
jgi:hypothetical protein